MSWTERKLSPDLGVEITGLGGKELVDPAAAITCQATLDQAGVVVFPEINIADDDLVEFSRLLGEVVANPTGEHAYPEIATITLDPAKTNAVLAWFRQGNFLWHIDGMTDERRNAPRFLRPAKSTTLGETRSSQLHMPHTKHCPMIRKPRSPTSASSTVSQLRNIEPIPMQPKRSEWDGTGPLSASTPSYGATGTAATLCCWGQLLRQS